MVDREDYLRRVSAAAAENLSSYRNKPEPVQAVIREAVFTLTKHIDEVRQGRWVSGVSWITTYCSDYGGIRKPGPYRELAEEARDSIVEVGVRPSVAETILLSSFSRVVRMVAYQVDNMDDLKAKLRKGGRIRGDTEGRTLHTKELKGPDVKQITLIGLSLDKQLRSQS